MAHSPIGCVNLEFSRIGSVVRRLCRSRIPTTRAPCALRAVSGERSGGWRSSATCHFRRGTQQPVHVAASQVLAARRLFLLFVCLFIYLPLPDPSEILFCYFVVFSNGRVRYCRTPQSRSERAAICASASSAPAMGRTLAICACDGKLDARGRGVVFRALA